MSSERVQQIAQQTFDSHPELRREDQAEELLRRTIWRLNTANIRAGRQRNPSGLLSRDKLAVTLADGDHAYDLYGLQTPLSFAFGEVVPPNLVPDDGIADGSAPPVTPTPEEPPLVVPPLVDLSAISDTVNALGLALAYLKALDLSHDEANERRYQDLKVHAEAIGAQIKQLQFEGTVRIPYLGTATFTLKVKPS